MATHLVQPHPRDEGLLLLTDASDKAGVKGRGDQRGHVLGARSALEHFHVEGVVVSGLHRQQLTLLQTGGVFRGVVHHCKGRVVILLGLNLKVATLNVKGVYVRGRHFLGSHLRVDDGDLEQFHSIGG